MLLLLLLFFLAQIRSLLVDARKHLSPSETDLLIESILRSWALQDRLSNKEMLQETAGLLSLVSSPAAALDARLFLASLPLQQQQQQQQLGMEGSSFSRTPESSFCHQQIKICFDIAVELNNKEMLEQCRETARRMGDLHLQDIIHARLLLLQRNSSSGSSKSSSSKSSKPKK